MRIASSRPLAPGFTSRPARTRGFRVHAVLPEVEPSFLDHAAAQITPVLSSIAENSDAAATAEAVTTRQTGPLTPLANTFETILKVLDNGLEAVHVPYSYGFAIILLTVLVKASTFPLTKKQVQSTQAMQVLQPRVKELQDKYKNDQERLQLETARLYKEAGVNPLAGCLPTLVTIPVFIGLYRALSNAADDGLLKEGFFWIPSLSGPTTIAARTAGAGTNWLFPFKDGHPPIGWHDAGAYLVLPVLLIASQFVSQRIMQPPSASQDPAAQQTQAILKFLPLMIGWFSLNVPSGLTLYWITNNVLTTAQSVYLRRTAPAPAAAVAASQPPMGSTTIVKEKEPEPKRLSGKETGARRKKGDKFRQLKEAEKAKSAAAKAAQQAAEGGAANGEAARESANGVVNETVGNQREN